MGLLRKKNNSILNSPIHLLNGLFSNEADLQVFIDLLNKFTLKTTDEGQQILLNPSDESNGYIEIIKKTAEDAYKNTGLKTDIIDGFRDYKSKDFDYYFGQNDAEFYSTDTSDFIVSEPESKYDSSPKIILKEALRLKEIIKDIYKDNEVIFSISPREFEEVVAELLQKQNFKTELTKCTRDGGYDIIAVQNIGSFRNKFLVECKRNRKNRPVDINVIRSFSDVIRSNNVNKGIICTTSYFSPESQKKAQLTPISIRIKG